MKLKISVFMILVFTISSDLQSGSGHVNANKAAGPIRVDVEMQTDDTANYPSLILIRESCNRLQVTFDEVQEKAVIMQYAKQRSLTFPSRQAVVPLSYTPIKLPGIDMHDVESLNSTDSDEI